VFSSDYFNISSLQDLPYCCISDLQAFKISPRELTSLSTGKSVGRVATFLPPARLVILKHFFQSR